ncbi:MAG: S26 family signal peptidase [Actinomycetota bacterium]|nr:S26 family signal peptidase [Actinomycetota bacterium]MDQ2958298.1 S26 family signal peptidase [Actinomycetota bacterium]
MATRRDRLLLAATLALLLGCLAVGGFWLAGGRWLTVRTPSMAETAPVGTLLITRPVGQQQLRPGEFVVFQPPTEPGQRYAHRIVSIDPDGTIHTKGDLNGSVDAWVLRRSDVSGRVVARLWGLGWLLRALPVLLFGVLLVIACCRYWVRRSRRLPAEVLGVCVVVALTLLWLKPLVRADILSMTSNEDSATATVVGTGLLPIRARATGAGSISLRPGHSGVLSVRDPATGLFQLHVGPQLSPLLWLLLVCCWLLPLAVLLAVGVRPREPSASL